jgi:SHS2 domain-containing protein
MTTWNIPGCEYFEHDADVGVIGRGRSIEEAFVSAARSLFALITDLRQICARERIDIEFHEGDIELAFVTWLNLLLAHAHQRGLALCDFSLVHRSDNWRGIAWGEPWRAEFERGIDVKGATLTMLEVSENNGAWLARCVVDV